MILRPQGDDGIERLCQRHLEEFYTLCRRAGGYVDAMTHQLDQGCCDTAGCRRRGAVMLVARDESYTLRCEPCSRMLTDGGSATGAHGTEPAGRVGFKPRSGLTVVPIVLVLVLVGIVGPASPARWAQAGAAICGLAAVMWWAAGAVGRYATGAVFRVMSTALAIAAAVVMAAQMGVATRPGQLAIAAIAVALAGALIEFDRFTAVRARRASRVHRIVRAVDTWGRRQHLVAHGILLRHRKQRNERASERASRRSHSHDPWDDNQVERR